MNANPPPVPPVAAATQPASTPASPPRFPFSLLFLVWIAVVLAATLVTFVLPESFRSTARIQVERDRTDLLGLSNQPPVTTFDPSFIPTAIEVIQSELILGPVIDKLHLNNEWGKQYNNGQKLKTQETMTGLRSRLVLRQVRNTPIIEIQTYSESPVEAAELANTVVACYRQFRLDQVRQLAGGGVKALETKLKAQDVNIRRAQEELARLTQPAANAQPPDLQKLAYLEKQKDLELLNDIRRQLMRRITIEDIELNLPRSGQVMIIENAVPGEAPDRPNKPLNITLGALIGGIVGLLLATLVYLLQRRAFRRQSGTGDPPNLRRLRTVLRVIIGVLVGVIVGYNCAMPMTPFSLFLMQIFVFLGGVAFVFVELAIPTTIAPAAPSQNPW